MKDKRKTKKQLINELVEMHQRIVELEASETKHRQAKEATKLAYAELDQIFNTAADGMRVVDEDFNVLRINKTFLNLSGVSKDEAVGKKCYEVLHGPMCHTPNCPLTRILGGEKRVEYEVEKERKDGIKIPCILTATLFRGSSGKLIGIVEDFKDITERKQAEDALRKAHDELEIRVQERTAELAKANEELRIEMSERKRAEKALAQQAQKLARSNAELQQFAYIASHDLQEPLHTVSGYIHLLEQRYKGKLGAGADNFIARTVNSVKDMQTLINYLLAYSRVGTHAKPFKPTDCKAVFDRTITSLQVAIERSGAVVTHSPLPTVMADVSQLIQLFQNLIGNAIKFRGKEPPHVHISAEQKENEWVFSVRDNGIGIDPKHAEDIFIIFQRLHDKGKYPGTGIGLAVCKKIVERHGGRIWMESKPGKGSTFYFTIPIKDGEQAS